MDKRNEAQAIMLDKKLIEDLSSGTFVGVIGTLITSLISKENVIQKTKNFAAGVCSAVLVTWILRNSNWAPEFKEIFIGACAAFIGNIWPQLSDLIGVSFALLRFVIKAIIEKKGNIKIPNDVIEKKDKDVV